MIGIQSSDLRSNQFVDVTLFAKRVLYVQLNIKKSHFEILNTVYPEMHGASCTQFFTNYICNL